MQGASILDLCAGTGALGIEAMSRGARQAVFVDKLPLAIKLVKANISTYQQSTSHSQKLTNTPYAIYQKDIRKGLNFLTTEANSIPPPFDIIFLDPPYAKGLSTSILKDICQLHLLNRTGILIIEESSKVKELDSHHHDFILFDKRVYGDTTFWFYKYP